MDNLKCGQSWKVIYKLLSENHNSDYISLVTELQVVQSYPGNHDENGKVKVVGDGPLVCTT